MLEQVPKLSEDARGELPAANDKLKNSRGTLAHWVITTLSVLSAVTMGMIYTGLRSDKARLEEKLDRYERILIPRLNETEKKLEDIEPVVDTIQEKADANEQNYNEILKKANHVRKRIAK